MENDKKYNTADISKAIGSVALNREYSIPISSLFTQVFGLAGPLIRRYKVPSDDKNGEKPTYNIGELAPEVTEDTITSMLGTPIHFWMAFGACDYNKRSKGEIITVAREFTYLPFTSIATFSRAKRKTVTYQSGMNGPVIEEYGFEAWQIRIQGLILNGENNKTLEQQVKALQLFEELSDSIEVQGKLFEWLKINRICFDQINFLPKRENNILSVIPFEINAMSVEPIELIEDNFFENL
jgi:hypothetical protein